MQEVPMSNKRLRCQFAYWLTPNLLTLGKNIDHVMSMLSLTRSFGFLADARKLASD
jgi:hypothetical protein